MNDKSNFSLERRLCVVCGATYETGYLLFDKRLRARLERYTTTGWGLCAEHQRRFDNGFVALIECDLQRSGKSSGTDRLKPEQAYRTGKLAHLKRDAFAALFNIPLCADQPCVFVEPGIIDRIAAMVASSPS